VITICDVKTIVLWLYSHDSMITFQLSAWLSGSLTTLVTALVIPTIITLHRTGFELRIVTVLQIQPTEPGRPSVDGYRRIVGGDCAPLSLYTVGKKRRVLRRSIYPRLAYVYDCQNSSASCVPAAHCGWFPMSDQKASHLSALTFFAGWPLRILDHTQAAIQFLSIRIFVH